MSLPSDSDKHSHGRGNAWTRDRLLILANLVKERWRSLDLGNSNPSSKRKDMLRHYV